MLSFLSVLSFLFVHQGRRSGEREEDNNDGTERKMVEQCGEEEVTVTTQLTSEYPQER